jgi:D-lyxose ketol-isomerase
MRRSEINRAIAEAEEDFRQVGYALPGFANWTLDEWREKGESIRDLVAAGLGWDVTDFGEDNFAKKGLLLLTVRNGFLGRGPGNRPYAEKIMISRQDQLTPMHRHESKTEDIINRASLSEGATLAVKLFESDETGAVSRSKRVTAYLDGIAKEVDPGTLVELSPGESITLFPGTFHAFWGQNGDVVVGEVSTVNDDGIDNFFAEPLSRFTEIEEDEASYRPLTTDHALA